MRKLLVVILFCGVQFRGYCQTRDDSIRQAFLFVDTILAAGTHSYNIVDFIYPQEYQDLMIKFNNAVSSNRQWYVDYIKKYYVPGKGHPYDTLFGVTKKEYDRLKDIENVQTELKVFASGEFEMKKDSGMISFKTQGVGRLLDFLKIDLKHDLIFFDSDTIEYTELMNVNNTTRMGPWKGYVWRKERTNVMSVNKLEDTNSKTINIIFGILNSGQRFIRIKYLLMENGKSEANADMLMYYK